MQRLKKPLVWLTLFSMIIALFPVGLISTAEAASATYFIPDDTQIKSSANMVLSSQDVRSQNEIKVVSTPTIPINGSYSKVSGETLSAQIDLLKWVDAKGTKPGGWEPDKQYSTVGNVQVDTSNSNRFNAPAITLFPGLNKITLKGRFGNVEGSDVFYVLYDKIPYFTKLTLNGSGIADVVNLNEDTRVLSKNPMVYITGDVFNANKATISVNGGQELSSEIFDNKMSSSPITLKTGLNQVKITFTNGSDSFSITREIYHFTQEQPFIELIAVDQNAKGSNLLNNKPYVKTQPSKFIAQMMLPYNSDTDLFYKTDNSLVKVNGTAVTPTAISSKLYDDKGVFAPSTVTPGEEEIIIRDSTGPVYRMITFEFTPATAISQNADGSYTPEIEVNYSLNTNNSWKTTAKYIPTYYVDNKIAIEQINYLPDYTDKNPNFLNKVPLNGAVINKDVYYIEVVTDDVQTGQLTMKYLPGGDELTINPETINTNNPNSKIYKITGNAAGERKIRFTVGNGLPKEVTVSFSTAIGIIIDNLIDGQNYTINTMNTGVIPPLVVTGKYSGTTKWENGSAEYFVNGLRNDGDIKNSSDLINPAGFTLKIDIDAIDGPLTAGENTIEFRGQYRDSINNLVPVSKKIRVYIVDENVANVSNFSPGIPEKVITFPNNDDFTATPRTADTEKIISEILKLPVEFSYKDSIYTTGEDEYNLVIRGNGARLVNLNFGSDQLFSLNIPEKPNGWSFTQPANYRIEAIGNQDDFIIRISNAAENQGVMRFERGASGTHVYALELINKTGARTSQRMEVTRELGGYRILAPKPTVGEQIVVNKNFVRFDIEAEGATKVVIGKEEAVRSIDPKQPDRFTLDYVGLKPDKSNAIKLQIVRPGRTINDTINVYYTSSVGVDSQYMAEKVSNKYTVFNKGLTLSFPKGTIMQSINRVDNQQRERKFYPNNKLLFGIADPTNGVVERVDDYGRHYMNYANSNDKFGSGNDSFLDSYKANFTSTAQTFNFTRISEIYWLSGGLAEYGTEQATNGVAPYSKHGFFTSPELSNRDIVPSERGTLTISYDKNVVNDAGTQVTVFKYTDVGGRGMWQRVPGTVNTGQHTVTVPFDEFGYYAVYKLNRSFSDVTNHPWARNILNALYSKGIMEYLRADAFGADDQTTRGEFATLLVKGLSLPINASDSQQSFFDVPYGAKTITWDYEHLETAARAGIITGKIEGFFSPNLPITRQEAAVMIARAAKLKLDTNDDKLSAKLAKSYLDSGKIEYYARPAVQAVSGAKIMSGSPVTLQGAKKASFNFNPTSNMTRAEAAKIAIELFKKNKTTKDMFPKNFN
jgi:hypothetical protein